MAGNKGMLNRIQVVNGLQNSFSKLGIDFFFELPQIAVVGDQSTGKSSVLESFVGREFLPRGSGIVTRRPLILQLIQSEGEEYVEFDHAPEKRYRLKDVSAEINAATDRDAGRNKGITEKPLTIKIFSPTVLTLTLIDLPGLTRNPVGDQPDHIYQMLKDMIYEYIKEDSCLILVVSPATHDLSTSEALKMAREVDPEGNRTFGVITKLDLMDKGTDASDIFTGNVKTGLYLKRGYVGVVNRSQEEINSNQSIAESLKAEKKFFSTHPAYQGIAIADQMGCICLQKLLNQALGKHIGTILPNYKQTLQRKLYRIEEKIDELKLPASANPLRKLLELIKTFGKDFGLDVGRSESVEVAITELSGGAPRLTKL